MADVDDKIHPRPDASIIDAFRRWEDAERRITEAYNSGKIDDDTEKGMEKEILDNHSNSKAIAMEAISYPAVGIVGLSIKVFMLFYLSGFGNYYAEGEPMCFPSPSTPLTFSGSIDEIAMARSIILDVVRFYPELARLVTLSVTAQ